MQIKAARDATSLLSEWLSSMKGPTASAGSTWGSGNPRVLLGGLHTGAATMETEWRRLGSYQEGYLIPQQFRPGYLSQGRRNTSSKQSVPHRVLCRATHLVNAGKQQKCPSGDGWTRKRGYISTTESSSAVTRTKSLVDPEGPVRSGMSQAEKDRAARSHSHAGATEQEQRAIQTEGAQSGLVLAPWGWESSD